MAVVPSPELVADSGLVYVHDDMPGIARRSSAGRFHYYSPNGDKVKSRATIKRIERLAIPPAYTDVWICPLENGHLQATGRDARRRKQYRYHPNWIALTNGNKFSRMLEFGVALPAIRAKVDEDLCKKNLPREKVLATVVWFLEKSLIRIGNEEYAKQNKSFGLTTMKMRHCKVEGAVISFHFVGKKGIRHDIEVADRRMARLVKKIQELPGQELFQYVDEAGTCHSVTSSDVNAYLKEVAGHDFTAKDFRTWSATVQALTELSACCGFASAREAKRSITAAMESVSEHLGNTPAICRKSYVHPGVVNAFLDGGLEAFLGARQRRDREAEAITLELLKKLDKESAGPIAVRA